MSGVYGSGILASAKGQSPVSSERVGLLKEPKTKLSQWRLISLSCYWFPLFYHSTLLSFIFLPTQVFHYTGDADKGLGMGTAMTSLLATVITAPLVGILSDRTTSRFGRRKPFILAATVANCAVGFGLSFSPSLPVFTVFMTLDVMTFMTIYSTLSAYIPDLVPEEQNGAASGWNQAFVAMGSVLACITGLFIIPLGTIPGAQMFNAYVIEILFMFAGVWVPLIFVKEEPVEKAPPFSWQELKQKVKPLLTRNYIFLMLVIALSQGFTIAAVQNFYQYYVIDLIPLPVTVLHVYTVDNIEAAISLFTLGILVGSLLAGYPGGRLSDHIGRQAVITIALLFQMVTALGLIFTKNYELDLLFAIAFGIGNASFNGSTFALLADILPSLHGDGESPKNAFVIGLSTVSMTLPSVLAPLLDGFIIDSQHARDRAQLGYQILYSTCVLYLLLAIVFTWVLRPNKSQQKHIQDLN